jgi:hypothetical protein
VLLSLISVTGVDGRIILRWIFRKMGVGGRPRRRWEDNIKMDL